MSEWLWPVLFFAAYIILMRWVLPRFGVATWMAISCRVESRPGAVKDKKHTAS